MGLGRDPLYSSTDATLPAPAREELLGNLPDLDRRLRAMAREHLARM